jgi:hypothetical protein
MNGLDWWEGVATGTLVVRSDMADGVARLPDDGNTAVLVFKPK